jgi:hypothetical protein
MGTHAGGRRTQTKTTNNPTAKGHLAQFAATTTTTTTTKKAN